MTSNDRPDMNGFARPPYHFVNGDVNLLMITEAAGLVTDPYGTTNYIVERGFGALMEIFSEGELRVLVGDDVDNIDAAQSQKGDDRYGEFYTKITKAREEALAEGGPLADEFNKLARMCGTILAGRLATGNVVLPSNNIAKPYFSPVTGHVNVTFDEYNWVSPSDTAVILDQGPGLGGTRFLDVLVNAIRYGFRPFQYIGFSNGPFVNEFLLDYWGNEMERHFGSDGRRFANSGELFMGREDGMQQATRTLLATPQPGGTSEVCDLMLMTGVHRANPIELEDTIRMSPQLLHETGKLMLSAPLVEVAPDVTTFDSQLAWAEDSGLYIEWAKIVSTGDSRMGTATHSGLAVLRK